MGRALLAVALAALAGACSPPAPPEPAAEDIRDARLAALAFQGRLKAELLDRLDYSDPVAVYMAYRDHVRDMLEETGAKHDVTLKRTGLGVRNRANIPDDWEYGQLEAFAEAVAQGFDPATLEASAIVEEDGAQVFRWMRPTTAEEPCLVCHGDAISEKLLDMLARDYPDDEAVGYFPYEMLGAISARRVIEPGPD
ncbi:MAG: DUF3365 domain-containing protein [Hyphomonadaceae bacterium]